MLCEGAREVERTREKIRFSIERRSLVYGQEKQNYQQYLSRSDPFHVDMMDHALHVWSVVVNAKTMIAGMNYKCMPPFPGKFATNSKLEHCT